MKKPIVLAALAASAIAATASAGTKWNRSVTLDPSYRYAYGSVGTARNSTDNLQYIGCEAYYFSSGFVHLYCAARNAAGTTVSCYTSNLTQVQAASQMTDSSLIYFTYDANNVCTLVAISNYSAYEPKQ
jgi:hypothetical protein